MVTKKNNKLDIRLLIAVIILTAIGWIMVISAHTRVYLEYGAFKFYFEIAKVTFFIIVGFFLMIWIKNKFDLDKIMKLLPRISLVVGLMMVSTLFFAGANGAKAWIQTPFMSIQPVEFVKVVLILFLASYFGKYYHTKAPANRILIFPCVILFAVFSFVFLLQNDLGSALILIIIALCMFLAIPEKKYDKYKIGICIFMVVVIVIFYLFGKEMSDFIYNLPQGFPLKAQMLRIAVLFDPLREANSVGNQLTNSLIALTNATPFGVGVGGSETKLIIPEAYNDAILSVIAEELGLFGILVVFSVYIYIISRLLSYAKIHQIDIRDRLILIGIASFFMAQFFVNIGGMIGLIPMTGVTLLFISSGGSSIIAAFAAVGIALGVIKRYIK
ncbi:cell division protein FtsW [Bacilli bacterium PM5-3]|nr:cell division protein FtsW [Bacilli bacterium PM5-3]MDH6602923.1 cell division protein FtsW [Bacilli bacterium PM5-9]